MKKHLNIKIFGRVQGVFFRYTARKKAKELGIGGFVRNEEGGSVYIEAEGESENLEKFLEWSRRGSSLAKVERIEYKEGELRGFSDFN